MAEATGRFHVVNGQIIDPANNPYFARGVNVSDSQMASADQILAQLPGINFIRLGVYSFQSPETYAPFIATMTSHGVVVALENHNNGTAENNGGGRGGAFTGTQLETESAWYSSVAKAYASNSYVWFGTNNEPPLEGLSPWQQATYDVIRGAGNNAPILMEWPGGGVPGLDLTGHGMDPAVYLKMSNIIGDIHYYGWQSKFSTDQSTVDATLVQMIRYAKTMESMDGPVPVIIGEYGQSTDGTTDDPNHVQVVRAVQQSTQIAGAVGYAWNGGVNDNTVDGSGNLTWFGQQVAQWLATPGIIHPSTDSTSTDPIPTPATSPPSTVSADQLSIVLSGDAYQGSPEFIASIDGQVLTTAPVTVTATHDVDTQTFAFSGNWGGGHHEVQIEFVNDLYSGPGADRNLYVEQVAFNGHAALSATLAQHSNGPLVIAVS
jgi:hypothetical protein